MRKSELEKLVKEQGEKIEKLGIIPKSREIATKLGVKSGTSEEWANANYILEDALLRVHYEVYAMGDRRIEIAYNKEPMFHAKEGFLQPKFQDPLIVHEGRYAFEIWEYKPGPWTKRIEDLYNSISKVLETRKQEKEKEEALAKDPEVSENELKELEDRLGIKK